MSGTRIVVAREPSRWIFFHVADSDKHEAEMAEELGCDGARCQVRNKTDAEALVAQLNEDKERAETYARLHDLSEKKWAKSHDKAWQNQLRAEESEATVERMEQERASILERLRVEFGIDWATDDLPYVVAELAKRLIGKAIACGKLERDLAKLRGREQRAPEWPHTADCQHGIILGAVCNTCQAIVDEPAKGPTDDVD